MNWDEQVALDIKHSKDPQPGDYWEDHMCGVLIVVAVSHGMVIFFDERIDVPPDHWQFDESKPKALTVADFTKRLQYKSEGMGEKTWANVHPKRTV